jgi:hypothetical protein
VTSTRAGYVGVQPDARRAGRAENQINLLAVDWDSELSQSEVITSGRAGWFSAEEDEMGHHLDGTWKKFRWRMQRQVSLTTGWQTSFAALR